MPPVNTSRLFFYLRNVSATIFGLLITLSGFVPTASAIRFLPASPQVSQSSVEGQEKEKKARQYEADFAREQAIATGFEPRVGKIARLANHPADGSGSMIADGDVLVSADRAPVLSLRRFHDMCTFERLYRTPDDTEGCGFQPADVATALAAMDTIIKKDIADGALFFVPFGTHVRVIAFHPPGYIPPPDGMPRTESAKNFEKIVRNNAFDSTYLVEIMEGKAKGRRVWTESARQVMPLRGDLVYLYYPNHPKLSVPVADFNPPKDDLFPGLVRPIPLDLVAAIPVEGQATDAKQKVRFDRLVREKRIVLFPPGTCFYVRRDSKEGNVFLVEPQEDVVVNGVKQRGQFIARIEHMALRKLP